MSVESTEFEQEQVATPTPENEANTRQEGSKPQEALKIEAFNLGLKVYEYKVVDYFADRFFELKRNYEDLNPDRPPENAVFDPNFQEQYVREKVKLVKLMNCVRRFLASPGADNFQEVMSEVDLCFDDDRHKGGMTKEEVKEGIREELKLYQGEAEMAEDLYKNTDPAELFEKLTGSKSFGLIEMGIKGNCLIVSTFDDVDYINAGPKTNEKSGGIYCRKKITQNGSEREVPVIFIRGKVPENIDKELFARFKHDFFEYSAGRYEEIVGKSSVDSRGNRTSAYKIWMHSQSNILWSEFALDVMRSGEAGIKMSEYSSEGVESYLFDLDSISEHEGQHHNFHHIIIESADLPYEISKPEDLDAYFRGIYEGTQRALHDEFIAKMKDSLREAEKMATHYFVSMTVGDVYNFANDQGIHKIGAHLKSAGSSDMEIGESKRYIDGRVKVAMQPSLYYFPAEYKKVTYSNIKRNLGKERFAEWKIKERFKDEVERPFMETRDRLLKQVNEFLRFISIEFSGGISIGYSPRSVAMSRDADLRDGPYKYVEYLESEPIEYWPLFFRWVKSNKNVRDIVEKEI